MRTFLALICSLALTCAAGGAQEENKSKKPAAKAEQAQSTQHATGPAAHHVAISFGDDRTIEAKGFQQASPRSGQRQATSNVRGPGKLEGGKKRGEKVSPTRHPR